jgi:hypothetical protein
LAISEIDPQLGLMTGVKLRGAEGAQRLRATSASTAELDRCHCANTSA